MSLLNSSATLSRSMTLLTSLMLLFFLVYSESRSNCDPHAANPPTHDLSNILTMSLPSRGPLG